MGQLAILADMNNFPIDAIITWVDGNDPVHKAKRRSYISCAEEDKSDDIGGETRFMSSGEIVCCVGSILRYAPFVRKIFIVTDSQRPRLENFIAPNFPLSQTTVEIVDHREIFRGYEDFLPTFNSLSIETMLYRIPGLSEHYVYFNDDVFIMSDVCPADWFEGDKAICFGRRYPAALARVLKAIKPKINGHKPFGHKDAMLNAADILGSRWFWKTPHSPLPLKKSWFENFYAGRPELVGRNARFRFREPTQFNPQSLFYIGAVAGGECVVKPEKGKTLFIKSGKEGYMVRKLHEAGTGHYRYGCINSLDKATEADRELFFRWFREKLKIAAQ